MFRPVRVQGPVPACRRRRWWRRPHPVGIVHEDPVTKRVCSETEEEYQRRMRRHCSACGKAGHIMCWPQLMPGESVTFNLPVDEL